MAWNSLSWLLHCCSAHRPRSQIPAQPWAFRHYLGYVIGVPFSSPASWMDLILMLWGAYLIDGSLGRTRDCTAACLRPCLCPCILLTLMGSPGCILDLSYCLLCWELLMDLASSPQLCPMCSDPVRLQLISESTAHFGVTSG